MTTINEFIGSYWFLSNFSESAVRGYNIHLVFPTVEHAYQAAKSDDITKQEYIAHLETPREAKKFGRQTQLRDDWEYIKIDVMYDLLWKKFSMHQDLHDQLLQTDHVYLREGNTWNDQFWGSVKNGEQWQGCNCLGYLLMSIRERLRAYERAGFSIETLPER